MSNQDETIQAIIGQCQAIIDDLADEHPPMFLEGCLYAVSDEDRYFDACGAATSVFLAAQQAASERVALG